jgi:hypothetical protein
MGCQVDQPLLRLTIFWNFVITFVYCKCECRQSWNLSCSLLYLEREMMGAGGEKERLVRLGPNLERANGVYYLDSEGWTHSV